jgi:hypothetical protein
MGVADLEWHIFNHPVLWADRLVGENLRIYPVHAISSAQTRRAEADQRKIERGSGGALSARMALINKTYVQAMRSIIKTSTDIGIGPSIQL